MKKLIILFGVVIIVFVYFFFDNPPEREPYMEGYIVEADFMRQLVVTGITEEQSKNITQQELLELDNVVAVWFTKYNFFQFREGQKVRVWIDGGVEESFPGQAKAEFIEVVSK